MVSVGEMPDALVVERQIGREGARDERRHAGTDVDQPTRAIGRRGSRSTLF
jgi:hypothetical protein